MNCFLQTYRWPRLKRGALVAVFVAAIAMLNELRAQETPPSPPGGPRGAGGPGFGGGPRNQPEKKVVKEFDRDGDGRLNATERKAARESLAKEPAQRWGPRRGGPPTGAEPQPGPKVTPADVKSYPEAGLYDPQVVRTLFLDFESADWEKELSDFHNTDVEVPARLTVDGKVYPDVGVHFRGMSSYMTVREGQKRSLNVAVDFAHKDQELLGYRTLNLLNGHADPTLLRAVLYSHIAREYIPAAKANFVKVVINGESWGIYINEQQFNKDFIKEWYDTTKGARWKVPGSPGGRGSLSYLGEDTSAYKRIYEIKSKDDDQSWADLVRLCKTLTSTPADKLESALSPILDVDGALKFLALENVFINNDGYWIRSSDYNLYQDTQGRFHIIPHDTNETFGRPGGPGFGGRRAAPGAGGPTAPGGSGIGGSPVEGVKLDPLVGAGDASKPLISKLLAVPAWRTRYLGYVHELAIKWLDWDRLGPVAQQYHDLIADQVQADTRKLDTLEAFTEGLTTDTKGGGFGPDGGGSIALKNFADQRRAFLLNLPNVIEAKPPADKSIRSN